jgi:hypothetical protein
MNVAQLKKTFRASSLAQIRDLKEDIIALISQLQVLLSQDKLLDLCFDLISLCQEKLFTKIAPAREEYVQYLTQAFDISDLESRKKRDKMLGEFRKLSKEGKDSVQWLTQALGNIVSTQTTSTRAHELKRLHRQNTIRGNVSIAKSMTFESLTEMLDEHAAQMGVLLVNIYTQPYEDYVREASYLGESWKALHVCALDSRTIYLEGLDAGIVLEQSQKGHFGPLSSQKGTSQPILALSTLGQRAECGSMLAWVCWDEFVNLEDPYSVCLKLRYI